MEFKKANRRKQEQAHQTLPLRGTAQSQKQPTPEVTPPPSDKKTPKVKGAALRPKLPRTKKGLALSAAVLLLIIVCLWFVFGQGGEARKSNGTGPGYQTVIPKGKSVDELGGWKRVSPPKAEPVYAYSDSLDNVGISVSQQPLPNSFEGRIDDQVAELAKRFNATDEVDADGTKIFIGTSAKGPQSAIFSKNGLLVLIKSQKKIDDKAWAFYVESLIGTDPTLSNF